MDNLVSVIVPSFNYQCYITDCLKSILNQSYNRIELIIIDDCSSDKSCEFIKEFIDNSESLNRFENIIFIRHNENKGAHFTINEGVEKASGEYVAIINADDLYEYNRFEEIIPRMIENKSHIAFGRINIIDEESNLLFNEESNDFIDTNLNTTHFKYVSHALILKNVAISTGNFVFKRELYYELDGFRNFKYIHDWDFILRASLLTEPLFVKSTNYLYRLHKTNSFRSLGNIADTEVEVVLKDFFRNIESGKHKNKNLDLESIDYIIKNYEYLNNYMSKHVGNVKLNWLFRFFKKVFVIKK